MNLTIVGLDVLGTSLGLALKSAAEGISVMGHDPDPEHVARARKLGAIDKSHWHLLSACEQADLIVLSLPLNEVEKTLTALRDELREQAVVVDLAPVKRPVLEWAKRILPEQGRFVGAHIVSPHPLLGDPPPSPELLREATFYIVAPEGTAASAISVVSNLALAIGAIPQYTDPVEHDGLVAATAQLPVVAALALLAAVAGSPGWADRARACGEELYGLGAALMGTSASADVLLANRDNLTRWFDAYMAELAGLQRVIAQGDHQALGVMLAQALKDYRACLPAGRALLTGQEASSAESRVEERSNWWRDTFLGRMGWRKPRQ